MNLPDQWNCFHFICEKYGLDDIKNRRLKISQIQDLNDPFEFLGFDLFQ
ncbi:MAG: hypothetical protein ACRD4P_00670 [Bryobacteraceae bacterium]